MDCKLSVQKINNSVTGFFSAVGVPLRSSPPSVSPTSGAKHHQRVSNRIKTLKPSVLKK